METRPYLPSCGGAALAYSHPSCWNNPRAPQVRTKTERRRGGRHIRRSLRNVLEGMMHSTHPCQHRFLSFHCIVDFSSRGVSTNNLFINLNKLLRT